MSDIEKHATGVRCHFSDINVSLAAIVGLWRKILTVFEVAAPSNLSDASIRKYNASYRETPFAAKILNGLFVQHEKNRRIVSRIYQLVSISFSSDSDNFIDHDLQ